MPGLQANESRWRDPSPVRAAFWAGLILLLLGLWSQAEAQTVLPDTLRPATGHRLVLEASGNPYHVNVMATLLAGDTLELRPGVQVLFANSMGITSFGTLLFEGKADSLITLDRQPDATMRWLGINMRHNGLSDTTTSRLRFTTINYSNTVVNANYPAPNDSSYSLILERCIFTNASLGVVCLSRGNLSVMNCIFDEISTFSTYSSGCEMTIKNNIFLPHAINYWNYGVMFFNPLPGFEDKVKYNCFYPGPDGAWDNYISYYRTGDQVYTDILPDSTHLITDPMLDEFFKPLLGSPVVDAGDPTMFDEDQTVVDMGVFFAAGSPVPCRFLTAPDLTQWVVGYSYLSFVEMEAYPPAQWELEGAPPGMSLVQVGRTRLALNWPVASQVAGVYPLTLRGQNVVDGTVEADSISVSLDFSPNHAPRLVRVEPCSSGDCLGQPEVLVTGLATGSAVPIRLDLVDEDSQRLGAAHSLELRYSLNGAASQLVNADSLRLVVMLDTNRVNLDLTFSDGLLSDRFSMGIQPLFTLMSGEVEGSIGAATGAVFLTAPISIPVGKSLVVEAGSRIVSSSNPGEQWLIDVQGELSLDGSPEAPIVVQSLLGNTRAEDARPLGLRIGPDAQLGSVSHVQFQGFSTALQLEHLASPQTLPISHCQFEDCRNGILAVGTPVDVTFCRFSPPADTLQLGATGIYLAASSGNRVQNNLFLNPEVGISVVDAGAVVANNSFLLVPVIDPVFHLPRWPQIPYLGFGRLHAFGADVDLRNNLFQWRSALYGDYFFEAQLEDFLDTAPMGVFLDASSQVSAEYNWFDCTNGWLLQGDTLLVNMSHLRAFSDSLLLASDLRAGADSARVDIAASYRLYADSKLVDAGDPAPEWADAFDGSRCDIGWTGGPLAQDSVGYTAVEGFQGPRHEEPTIVPGNFQLHAPYPNPFNPTTRMEVDVHRAGLLDLRIFDLLGRERAVLAHTQLEPGVYQVELNASGWASGTYFARARLDGQEITRPLLLLK